MNVKSNNTIGRVAKLIHLYCCAIARTYLQTCFLFQIKDRSLHIVDDSSNFVVVEYYKLCTLYNVVILKLTLWCQ